MLKIILLLCVINVFAEKPDGKRIDAVKNKVQQMLQQKLVAPEEAHKKTGEVIKDLKKDFGKRKERIKKIKQRVDILKNKKTASVSSHSKTRRTHVDFVIYNFERIDKDVSFLRDEIILLNEMLAEAHGREIKYISAFERMQEQNAANLPKFVRYDHFFMKWDGTKETMGDLTLLVGGGGGVTLAGIFTLLTRLFLRRRKGKKVTPEKAQ